MPVVEYLNKQNWTIITGFGNNFSRAPKVFNHKFYKQKGPMEKPGINWHLSSINYLTGVIGIEPPTEALMYKTAKS